MRRLILEHRCNVPRIIFDGICKLAGEFLRKEWIVFIVISHTDRPRCLRFPHFNQVNCDLLFNNFRPFLFLKDPFLIGPDSQLGHAPHNIPLANVFLIRWLPLDLAHQGLSQGKTDKIKDHLLCLILDNLLSYGL